MKILEIKNVTKRFGGLTAVNKVTFDLEEGEILGLIGPNGAGKTTLFNCINGVYKPTEGKVIFRGKDITGLPTYKSAHIGLSRTHQIVRPLNELTVLENAMVGACYGRKNMKLGDARKTAMEMLEFVGMADRTEVLAGTLNVAQKKRLEMARALSAKPYLLLLDEVLAGLNTAEVTHMLDTIRKIREQGVTIIMIEHIMHAVMSLSDRLIVLNYGSLIAEGTPDEVSQNPEVIEAYLGDPDLAARLLDEEKA